MGGRGPAVPAALACLAFALGPLAAASCAPLPQDHVWGAYAYDSTDDCLAVNGEVDVLPGPDPGTCSTVRCWQSHDGNAFVTDTACDAPPDFTDHSSDPQGSLCARALAAYQRAGHAACPEMDAGQ
jgi:hypothetical protein